MSIFLAILGFLKAFAPLIALAAVATTQQRAGAKAEAAKVEHVTATTEAAMAQAEVDAPATPMAVVDRLNAGTF